MMTAAANCAAALVDSSADFNVASAAPLPEIRYLSGLQDYETIWRAMQAFVETARCNAFTTATNDSGEALWVLQHNPVYTLGRAGKKQHLLRDNGIPLVCTDRGGQITYHGAGQVVVYCMANIRARRIGLRQFVCGIEKAVIKVLAAYGIAAFSEEGAPGVYVRRANNPADDKAKIAALGLRLRHGWTYHGVSLNVDMDLSPFADINPCGYEGLQVTQVVDELPREFAASVCINTIASELATALQTMIHHNTNAER